MTHEELELLADLIVARLAPRVELLDAEQLAERLGRSREFVYDHAAELGAVRLGSRLAFRWPAVLDGLPTACGSSGESLEPETPVVTGRNASRGSARSGSVPALLPVKGSESPR